MKEYLLLFRNIPGNGQYVTTPEDMAEDMPKWQDWIGNIARQGKLVSTQPIFYEGRVISNKGIESQPSILQNQLVAGFLICKSDSLEEVLGWSRACPILKYTEGSVEIREMMPFAA